MGQKQIQNVSSRCAQIRNITCHKPVLSMFNKVTAKLPPRIERWVMDMQDVGYELVYEPEKDEQDRLDFLSRHPLPESDTDNAENVIKSVINSQHAIVFSVILLQRFKKDAKQTNKQDMMLVGLILQVNFHLKALQKKIFYCTVTCDN